MPIPYSPVTSVYYRLVTPGKGMSCGRGRDHSVE
jgi:hypothetical protein